MSSSTSIGRGPAHGSNENHDGDPRNKTLGETASQEEPPIGNDLIDEAAPACGGRFRWAPAGHPKGSGSCPDGPMSRPARELDAAQGKLSKLSPVGTVLRAVPARMIKIAVRFRSPRRTPC